MRRGQAEEQADEQRRGLLKPRGSRKHRTVSCWLTDLLLEMLRLPSPPEPGLTFSQLGLDYAFWSAFRVSEETQALKMEAQELGVDIHDLRAQRKREREQQRERERRRGGGQVEEEEEDERIRLLDGEELLELVEERARAAVKVRAG